MHDCPICALHSSKIAQSSYEIVRSNHWLLRHHPAPAPLLGWLLLDARRHLAGPVDFQPQEAASWGQATQRASQLIQQLTDCDRVYAIAFGEGAHHLHLHLIPRFQLDPDTTAWAVADHYRAVASGERAAVERAAVDPSQIAQFVQQARLIAASFDLDAV
jgi:diadenosine tetraphosphate (Ap4A) HIT family hydrolase